MLAGLPSTQLNRLQLVMNAGAWLVCLARKFEHIALLLRNIHCLRLSPRIKWKLITLVCCCLWYISAVSSCAPWQTLTCDRDFVLHWCQCSMFTIGDHAFSTAVRLVWNSLVPDVTTLPSFTCFKQQLKTLLFLCTHCMTPMYSLIVKCCSRSFFGVAALIILVSNNKIPEVLS